MRLLQLTTYPLKNPRHGGQLRCAAIRDCYRALGIEVETLAVMHEGAHRGDRERSDIALPAESPHWNPRLPRFVDLQAGDCLVGSAEAFAAFDAVLGRLRPHVIQLEQPWLYPAVKRWLDERAFDERTRPRLVYSSQNIEWKLKRDEADTGAATAPDFAREVRRVEALEREVVRAADLVIACTDEELSELRAMTDDAAGTRTWVTAHNAIAPYNPDPARVAAMRHRLGLERYPLFVGSAHPPNVDGFWRMLAPSLSFLRPDEKIVVAGSVGHLLRQHPTYAAWSGINEPRLAIVGEVEREDLVALLGGAAAILLPITTGGGSNLKTAEAIYSGRPVLATPHALRGYGDAAHWPTIRVEDGADGFRRTLRALLDAAQRAAGFPRFVLNAYSGHYQDWARSTIDARAGEKRSLINPLINIGLDMSAERKALLRSDPALPMIGGWNFESYLQTKGEWPTPDAGDAFRRPQRDDTPILFVQGDWDPSTPIENTLAMLPWFPNARMLVLHRAQHGGTFQWLRSRPELAARAYEFLRSGSFDGLPIEAALDPVAFEPPREM